MTFLNITLKENSQQIQRKIFEATRNYLNQKFPGMLKDFEDAAKKRIFYSVILQPEWESIRSGTLRVELGLVDGENRLYSILDYWLQNIEAKFTKFKAGNNLTGGVKLIAVNNNYADILSLPEANLVTEKGENLPWLKWLLTAGSQILIGDYSFEFQAGRGRTGGGFMDLGGSWGISQNYSGISGDNFITRAIDSVQNELVADLQKIIESKI